MLGKARYGMTLSEKSWHEEFRVWLVSVGLIQSETCPVIFTRYAPYTAGLNLDNRNFESVTDFRSVCYVYGRLGGRNRLFRAQVR
jgi:hypothetical protein